MENDMMRILAREGLERELRELNAVTEDAGLALSEEDIRAAAERVEQARRDSGRMEFGRSAVSKLAAAFMDSPHISRENYAETLMELIDAFYAFRADSDGLLTDDELPEIMRVYFDEVCFGESDLLQAATFPEMCRETGFLFRVYGGHSPWRN